MRGQGLSPCAFPKGPGQSRHPEGAPSRTDRPKQKAAVSLCPGETLERTGAHPSPTCPRPQISLYGLPDLTQEGCGGGEGAGSGAGLEEVNLSFKYTD